VNMLAVMSRQAQIQRPKLRAVGED
jgi:hypothetical protein